MIRAVIFDLEGTLLDGEQAHERALAEVFRVLVRFRPKLAEEELQRQWAGSLRMNVHGRGGRPASPQAIYAERFKTTLTWLGTEDDNLAVRLGRLYASLMLDRAVAYPDVRAVLPQLARKASLAVTAGVSTATAQRQLEASGLAVHVPWVFGGEWAARPKPAPDLLKVALREMEVLPSEVLAVGDGPDTDVAAAKAAGVASVWLNRRRLRWPDDDGGPEFMIWTLEELPALVG